MQSLILMVASRYLLPLMHVFSIYLLIRGHNKPGGGFVGGLVAATGFILYLMAHDVERARRVLRLDPRLLIAVGLSISLGSGLFSLVAGESFLTGIWLTMQVPVIGHFGTPLIFDTGIYLLVIGVVMLIVLSLAEET